MEKVALLKVSSYSQNLKENLDELIKLLGGLPSILKPGSTVLLKPNFVTARPPEKAVTTHPDFIVAMAELLLDHGCSVAVGESPGIGKASDVARKIGLLKALNSLGVQAVNFERSVEVSGWTREFPQFERRFHRLKLAGELLEYDHIINLPKLKTHGQMGLTLATKNLFGCVVGAQKGQWHYSAGKSLASFARLLVEIALTVHADLHVMDGIVGMDGNGPSNGRPRELNVILAATNPVALDRVVTELVGKKPRQIPVFAAAEGLGVPGTSLEEINVVGEKLDSCRIPDFLTPVLVDIGGLGGPVLRGLLGRLIRQRLTLDPGQCIKCRICEENCPVGAITFDDRIRIDESKCIKCCCCQEMCPVGALSISDPLALKTLRRLGLA